MLVLPMSVPQHDRQGLLARDVLDDGIVLVALQNMGQIPSVPNVNVIGLVSLFIGLASLFGILVTIILSVSSLTLQRSATARESLEQLDDIHIRGGRAKIRPILHKYKKRPGQKTVVKLKAYQPTDVAGVSRIRSAFLVFPGCIFQEYSVEAVSDGYNLKIASSNPVEIRRITDELLEKMMRESRDNRVRWRDFEMFQNEYQPAMEGELMQIHEDILDSLDTNSSRSVNDIENHIRNNLDRNTRFLQFALRDLLHADLIEPDPHDNDRYLQSEENNELS